MPDEPRPPADEPDETRAMNAGDGGTEATDPARTDTAPTDADLTAAIPSSSSAAPELSDMPAEIDGYRLLGVLGRGGMGVVYLAEQREPRRRVALKVIRESVRADSLHVRLFRREAETLGRLRHPNIGAIHGAGRLPDGRPYFAMELVEGPTLDAYLATRPSPANRAELLHRLKLAGRIAEAVHYAHQRGVIHRDLKPSNIVVPESTGSSAGSAAMPDVKVLDFGLARLTDDDSEASIMSSVGTIRGTLPYMSPEQVRGETQSLDVRSDVYTLGVILYEMLAGERPYEVSRASLPEAMRVISEQEPRPLRDTKSGMARVDTDLQSIVMKALAKEPEQRYSSAAALAEDLERYRTSQPVLARTESLSHAALDLAKGVRGGGEDAVGEALSTLGVMNEFTGRAEEALGYHRQALAAFQSAGAPSIGRVATSLDNIATSFSGLGRFEEADSVYLQAIPRAPGRGGEPPDGIRRNRDRPSWTRGDEHELRLLESGPPAPRTGPVREVGARTARGAHPSGQDPGRGEPQHGVAEL